MPVRRGEGIELLADVSRRRIIAMLAIKPCRPSTIARHIGLSRPTVSHHLRLLYDAGLVRTIRSWGDGRFVLYAIDPHAHGRITAWLAGTEIGIADIAAAAAEPDWGGVPQDGAGADRSTTVEGSRTR
jgi:DNA-binding transcriptional ArsR family regulator